MFEPFALRGASLPEAWLRWLARVLAGGPAGTPPAGDWRAALSAVEAHSLAPLLYATLKHTAAANNLPADMFPALAAAFQASAARSLRMEMALERITAALAGRDVPCLLLKGAALGRTVYASPAERPVSDFDLLAPRASLAAAQRALAGLGYARLSPPADGRLGRWLYRYKAESVAMGRAAGNQGLLVEVHWTLTELPYYIEAIDIAEAWRAAGPAPGLPGAGIPDPATLLIHGCAHLALHHSRDLRLIWLVDLHRLVTGAALDWQRVLHLAETWRLGLAVAAGLDAAGRWLGTAVPGDVRAALAHLAADPAGRAMWGLGDELLAGRWWRRAAATWAAFDGRQRIRYAAWLALRAAYRPVEWIRR